VGLVLDAADQVEPLLKLLLIKTFILALDRDDDILELVHEDGEESDTENLNDTTKDLLHDGLRAEVTVTYSR
jgi:hypothetical protein